MLDLQNEVEKVISVPVKDQRLFYRSQELHITPFKTLKECQIENNSIIRLVGEPKKTRYSNYIGETSPDNSQVIQNQPNIDQDYYHANYNNPYMNNNNKSVNNKNIPVNNSNTPLNYNNMIIPNNNNMNANQNNMYVNQNQTTGYQNQTTGYQNQPIVNQNQITTNSQNQVSHHPQTNYLPQFGNSGQNKIFQQNLAHAKK